jgi:hypothetical protein
MDAYYVVNLGINVPFGEAIFWASIEYVVVNRHTLQHLIP